MERGDRHVFIVGPRRIQNGLVALSLNEATGLPCTAAGSVGEARRLATGERAKRMLILVDCPAPSPQAVRQHLLLTGSPPPDQILGLFNVPAGQDIERETVPLGVRGFFYTSDGLDTLTKGIKALFAGELWMSRKAMAECLVALGRVSPTGANSQSSFLTPREREVLATLAAGACNEEIAARLAMSIHTVKTHVYRIFRKTGAVNRLEAALWAAKNL